MLSPSPVRMRMWLLAPLILIPSQLHLAENQLSHSLASGRFRHWMSSGSESIITAPFPVAITSKMTCLLIIEEAPFSRYFMFQGECRYPQCRYHRACLHCSRDHPTSGSEKESPVVTKITSGWSKRVVYCWPGFINVMHSSRAVPQVQRRTVGKYNENYACSKVRTR